MSPEPELQEAEVFSVKEHLATALNAPQARIPVLLETPPSISSLCVLGCVAGHGTGRKVPREVAPSLLNPL